MDRIWLLKKNHAVSKDDSNFPYSISRMTLRLPGEILSRSPAYAAPTKSPEVDGAKTWWSFSGTARHWFSEWGRQT